MMGLVLSFAGVQQDINLEILSVCTNSRYVSAFKKPVCQSLDGLRVAKFYPIHGLLQFP